MTVKIESALQPWQVPSFVCYVPSVRPRQEGFHQTPTIPLSELSATVLSDLCDEFRAGVFHKAAKSDPVEQETEALIYWLLRCYESGHRQGWEEGPSTQETMDRLLDVLANRGYDPNEDEAAKELMARMEKQ